MELDNKVEVEGTEQYSNFALFGIGKPTEKQKEKKEARKEKREAAHEEREGLSLFKRFTNLTQKVNPAAAIPRLGVLACMRLNVLGMARRLYPAFLTDEELKARNFDIENAKKAKKIWDSKIKDMWIMLGGRSVTLEEAIKKGYDKPVFNTKKQKAAKAAEKGASFNGEEQSNFAGYDDAAEIAAGISAVSAMAKTLTNNGVSKNPYAKGTPEYDKAAKDLAKAEQEGSMDAPAASD